MPTQITIGPGLAPAPPTQFAGANSFAAAKQLKIAIALAGGGATGTQPFSWADTGASTLTISNNRASIRATYAGGQIGSTADISIWGLSQSRMNEMATLGIELNKLARNLISVYAGDAVSGTSLVFTGNILQAWADYNAAPDVAMRFVCKAGALEGTQPFAPTSFNGKVSVVQVFSSIAHQAGWGFQNNGVDQSISVSNPYYPGSSVDQYNKLKKDVRINAALLPGNQPNQNYVLTIWPLSGGTPTFVGIPVISAATGMIGYPTFQHNGMMIVRMLYNPSIAPGNQIQVQTSIFTSQSLTALNNPNTLWVVARVDHALDTLVPKGQWMTTVQAWINAPFKPILPSPP